MLGGISQCHGSTEHAGQSASTTGRVSRRVTRSRAVRPHVGHTKRLIDLPIRTAGGGLSPARTRLASKQRGSRQRAARCPAARPLRVLSALALPTVRCRLMAGTGGEAIERAFQGYGTHRGDVPVIERDVESVGGRADNRRRAVVESGTGDGDQEAPLCEYEPPSNICPRQGPSHITHTTTTGHAPNPPNRPPRRIVPSCHRPPNAAIALEREACPQPSHPGRAPRRPRRRPHSRRSHRLP
ncbi:putative basic proline-rich protein-like [Streptomyces rapamycinicus NRRL 5491]|uniref:Putative basic proline-rich protein-like n=1 Tax=Streptomyces rapamycinicus (strain ATCC 29253 / DSM 41530 / NRRL 5491 / AYB-994) TaxID=1343740 RepID=A0A3L8RJS3_STRRN|nr:putative basic proline-rich protein-like [Streptomyces rapamycinicus NRRL 5491]